MTDTRTSVPLGVVTLDPHGNTEDAWARVRDLAQSGGLAPLPAARLALAATCLVGEPRGHCVIRVARVTDGTGGRVEAVVRADPGAGPPPPDLVDVSFERTSGDAVTEHVLSIAADSPSALDRPSWTALSDAAAHAASTRQLLAATLVAASRQPANPGTVDVETTALRMELDDTNRGMLALHAELSSRQEELERARADAVRASDAKAAFLATMSHEIRAPLGAVVGFTGLLLDTGLGPEQLEYAHAAQAAGGHLLGLVNDVLDLAKIEAGRLELEDVPFDLYGCVEDAAAILAPQAAEKDVPMAVLFAPGTPAVVRGDPLRVRQILVNLLGNAVKFTSSGQITVEVSHRPATATEHELTFRISDTGTGIPADALRRLFTPFAQAEASTARSYGGTGLGLSICLQLAEQMGGGATVESTYGEGSSFTCVIRAGMAVDDEASDDALLTGVQALVVHRNALTAEAVSRHLTSWGAEVVVASSPSAAADAAPRWTDAAVAFLDASQPATFADNAARICAAATRPYLPIVAVVALVSRPPLTGHLSVATPVRRATLRAATLAALGQQAPGDPGDRAAEPVPVAAPAPAPAARVLYVDDDPMMVALVARILSREPCVSLSTAPDAETALRLAATERPDVILLDLNLTGMKGDALIRVLRTDSATAAIPVVIVSGDASPASIDRLTHLGAAGYLTKPFRAAELEQAIRGVLVPAVPGPTG